MSVFDYRVFAEQFIKRTESNLKALQQLNDTIDKLRGETEATGLDYDLDIAFEKPLVYEATQLFNSLYGFVLILYERYQGYEEEDIQGFPGYEELKQTIKGIKKRSTYPDEGKEGCKRDDVTAFLRHLRNALAHLGRLRSLFIPEEGEIMGIILWDQCKAKEGEARPEDGKDHYRFCAEISSLQQLREIVDRLGKFFTSLKPKSQNYNKVFDYQGKLSNMRRFLEGK